MTNAVLPGSALACCASIALGVAIPTVPITGPGNPPDPLTGLGSVGYDYSIGATEVTNAQYAAFLGAVAQSDPQGLYNTNMSGVYGGIVRSGNPGAFSYAAVAGRENHPVNYVSYWDAVRFANWLHNGQPTGPQNASTTEDGAYTLTIHGILANLVPRNANWSWAVTSENEWYKAAYYQPAESGGDIDNYWLYPTSTNSISQAIANIDDMAGNTTPSGSYGSNYFGAVDMAGNVSEWNETMGVIQSSRRTRGGDFASPLQFSSIAASSVLSAANTTEIAIQGFRVSHVPSAPAMALFAGLGMVYFGRRRA